VHVYLPIYLVKYILILLTRKIDVQMLLYTLIKKVMEAQGFMLNQFGIIFFNMYLNAVYIVKHQ